MFWCQWVMYADTVTPIVYFGCYGVIVYSGRVTCCVGSLAEVQTAHLLLPLRKPESKHYKDNRLPWSAHSQQSPFLAANVIWQFCNSKQASLYSGVDPSWKLGIQLLSWWAWAGISCSNDRNIMAALIKKRARDKTCCVKNGSCCCFNGAFDCWWV